MAVHEFFWEKFIKSLHKKRTQFLVDILPNMGIYHKGSMLGLGVAEGNIDYLVSQKFGLGFLGLDIKSEPIYKYNYSYIRADASLLPFARELFDVISSFSLIEHIRIERRDIFFNEILRVLKNDGLLILQLPNRYFPIEQHSFLPLIGYLPERLHNYFNTYYCRVPSLKSLTKTLEKNGYRVTAVISYELPLSFFILKLLKFLGFFKILPFGFILFCRK